MSRILVKAIKAYQMFLSPDHSDWGRHRFPYGYCRFHPSCSEYTKQSIQKHGAVLGLVRGAWRVVRCNPYNPGGVDNV